MAATVVDDAAQGDVHPRPQSMLQALKREDVDRICSGQSVVDLATAVKELVENALDAGATLVEVKLRDSGRDAIEVSDNGRGVAPADFATLARKHFTSKIRAFDDIARVASFGFRGEALSSICQLASSFSVCTRTAEDELGSLLTYDQSGQLVKQVKKARPVGTTVVVEELFKPLPVRCKDFHRNLKRHYARLLKVLQAYAVSCVHVRIIVTNIAADRKGKHGGGGGGARQVVMSTQAHTGVGDNIASVFGTKFVRTLVPVDFDLNTAWPQPQPEREAKPVRQRHVHRADRVDDDDEHHEGTQDRESEDKDGDDEDDEDADVTMGTQLSQPSAERRIVGFVSKVGEGTGRSDNDRQFFFINSRPFDLPKFAKAVNDVWRQFEMKQKPACVLNLLLPSGEFDVNVTPDKRETFLRHEAHVVEAFKTLLTRMYEPTRGTFLVQPLLTTFAKSAQPTTTARSPAEDQSNARQSEEEAVVAARDSDMEGGEEEKGMHTRAIAGLRVVFETSPACDERIVHDDQPLATQVALSAAPVQSSSQDCCSGHGDRDGDNDFVILAQQTQFEAPGQTLEETTPTTERYLKYPSLQAKLSAMKEISDGRAQKISRLNGASDVPSTSHNVQRDGDDQDVVVLLGAPSKGSQVQMDGLMGDWSFTELRRQRCAFFQDEADRERKRKRPAHARLAVPQAGRADADAPDPDNELAAAALQRVLKKADFARMDVVGQFNLGFVIGKLGEEDLFIIDQHASDEKFNYETLQRTTVLHQQPLVRPLPLELTAGEEMVILDHLDVFARHGFTFLVRKDAQPTRKLQLLSLPFSKQTQFGVDDIRELASLLMETPLNAAAVRLPKLMAMFASRACRSSIMIGTALHKEEMVKIVRNLATLEQPWNCPHGRPTLRHLLDLTQLDEV